MWCPVWKGLPALRGEASGRRGERWQEAVRSRMHRLPREALGGGVARESTQISQKLCYVDNRSLCQTCRKGRIECGAPRSPAGGWPDFYRSWPDFWWVLPDSGPRVFLPGLRSPAQKSGEHIPPFPSRDFSWGRIPVGDGASRPSWAFYSEADPSIAPQGARGYAGQATSGRGSPTEPA